MKIFEHENVDEKVLPLQDFKLFCDENYDSSQLISPVFRDAILKSADEALELPIRILPASLYRDFILNGDRVKYETIYFERHKGAFSLFLGELASNKSGKYIDKLIDFVWSILEETTWVLPAHNNQLDNTKHQLPYEYKEKVESIDLFSAETGAILAIIYYYLKDEFEKAVPTLINDRILYELERRIFIPFMEVDRSWWTGLRGNYVNNWNPWIVANVLSAVSVCVTETERRTNFVKRSMTMIDNYIACCKYDGACEEGAGYWGVANAAVYTYLEVLYDMTGGKTNVYSLPFVRNLGEYIVKMHIQNNEFMNFADCAKNHFIDFRTLSRWGKNTNSNLLSDFAYSAYQSSRKMHQNNNNLLSTSISYRSLRCYISSDMPTGMELIHLPCYSIDSLQIMSARGTTKSNKDLFLGIKGGSNNEGHGHNDVGSFIVYVGKDPLFIDPGVGDYTKDTFSEKRYSIWTMRSPYHNAPSINGMEQSAGRFFASDVTADIENKEMKMELKHAYPNNAQILSAVRTAKIGTDEITIQDVISLENEGENTINLISIVKPTLLSDRSLEFLLDSGRVICTFTEGFTYSVEEIDISTLKLCREWNTDKIYRNQLTKSFKDGTFKLTVKAE